MTPITDATLKEIEAVAKVATPAPWTACNMVHEATNEPMTPEQVGNYVANSVIKSEGESGTRAFQFISAEKPDGPCDVALVGNGPTSPANAKLIELLRNNIEPLLARVREAERERDLARKAILDYGKGADFDWDVLGRIDELEAALIRLRDCDFVITPADRMDAVRDIARAALARSKGGGK